MVANLRAAAWGNFPAEAGCRGWQSGLSKRPPGPPLPLSPGALSQSSWGGCDCRGSRFIALGRIWWRGEWEVGGRTRTATGTATGPQEYAQPRTWGHRGTGEEHTSAHTRAGSQTPAAGSQVLCPLASLPEGPAPRGGPEGGTADSAQPAGLSATRRPGSGSWGAGTGRGARWAAARGRWRPPGRGRGGWGRLRPCCPGAGSAASAAPPTVAGAPRAPPSRRRAPAP